ncbi:MAG: hypothetical protein EBQ54_00300, partial [Actinobacteria bacterium]|nr:hypothetical protein [Actinomycetota bacterium]
SNNGTGIGRAVDNDLRYDVAFAIGTAKWGINSNIANFGQTESYYKFSYLWLGPIFNLFDLKAIDLIEASVPLLIVIFWVLLFGLSHNESPRIQRSPDCQQSLSTFKSFYLTHCN